MQNYNKKMNYPNPKRRFWDYKRLFKISYFIIRCISTRYIFLKLSIFGKFYAFLGENSASWVKIFL